MGKEPSFWDRLWNKSIDPQVLLQHWRDAHFQADPDRKLKELRALQHYFLKHPAEMPAWYLPFLQDFLQCSNLIEQDWRDAEEIGYVLQRSQITPLQPEIIWYQIFEEYKKRGMQKETTKILFRIYYDDVIRQVQSTKRPLSTAQINALTSLCEAMLWLDSRDIATPCPIKAPALVTMLSDAGLSSQISVSANLAIARLHLIEGDAWKALDRLPPDKLRKQSPPRIDYYLAWAKALTGDFTGVATCLSDAEKWHGRWTIACHLLEVDPEVARSKGLLTTNAHEILAVPEAYMTVFKFRLALVWSKLPSQVQWTVGTGTLEEDLEGLRSTLGYSFYTEDVRGMRFAMAMPLFQRLPQADQTTWKGLLAILSGERRQGYTLLERAARDLGARRAALILAVLLLQEKQLDEAQKMLQIATFSPDEFKRNLIHAHIQMLKGNLEDARQILEQKKLVERGQAQYALGNMYLYHAEEALHEGSLKRAQDYYKEATQAFDKSTKSQDIALPAVSSNRAGYAKDMATADTKLLVQLQQQRSNVLFSSKGQLRESWEEALTGLDSKTPALVATACEDLLELLPQMPPIQPKVLETIANVAAYQCTRAKKPEQAEKIVDLLSYLAERSKLAAAKKLYLQSIVTVNLLRYRRAGEQGEQQQDKVYQHLIQQSRLAANNFALAFLSAYASMQHHQQEQAVALLSAARPTDPLEQDVQAHLTQLLAEPQPAARRLPQIRRKEDAPVALARACTLLEATTAIATRRLDQGYEALLLAIQKEPEALVSLIDPHRLILLFCTYRREGALFVPFLDAALHLSTHLQDSEIALIPARYLASRGEVEHASAWWERVLAIDPTPQSTLRQEAIGFLCHRAVQDQQAGDYAAAIARLRLAAKFLTGEPHA